MRIHRVLPMALALAVATALALPAGAQQQGDPDAPAPAKPAQPKRAPAKPKPPVPAPLAGAAKPTLLGQFGDWGAYTATPGGKKVCFALAKPSNSQTNPPGRPRDPAFLFLSSRPTEKVKDEVSIIIGYGFKANSDATLELGGANYAMYTQNDGAWIKNAAEESKLVDAMRKGSDVTIKGTSARGTGTTDVFSLKGLAQALDKVGEECR